MNQFIKFFQEKRKSLYFGMSIALLYLGFLSTYHGDIGAFTRANLTYPILFKARAQLRATPNLSPKIKIYSLDDKSLQELGREELTLKEWLLLIEAIASRNPKAIFIDKIFTFPKQDISFPEFTARIKKLNIPVITISFTSPAPIPYREIKKIKSNSFTEAINKGKYPLEAEDISNYEGFPIEDLYLYGAHKALDEAFPIDGYTNYYGQGILPLFKRVSHNSYITHWAISEPIKTYFDRGNFYVNDQQVHIDDYARTLINFIPIEKIPQSRLYPTFRAAQKKNYHKIKIKPHQYVVILPSMYTGSPDFHSTPIGYIPGGLLMASVLNSSLTGQWLRPLPWEITLASLICFLGVLAGLKFRWITWLIFCSGTIVFMIIASIAMFTYIHIYSSFIITSIWFLIISLFAFSVSWLKLDRVSRAEKVKRDAMNQAAQAVQESLIPDFSEIRGAKVYSFYQAAEATGGDWLGVYGSENNRFLYLFIGDVTGHGFSSALLTGTVAGAIKAKIFELDKTPETPAKSLEILAQNVNRIVYQTGAKAARLMTMSFVCLDLVEQEGYYLNAGHCPIWKVSQHEVQPIFKGGSILGLQQDFKCTVKTFKFKDKDKFFLYTDGLIENTGPNGDVLKFRVIRNILQNQSNTILIIDDILNAAKKVWRNQVADDDCTFFILEVNQKSIS